jgi:ring-1,2-phenylacetyl-CoA epoxidase subunit PaaE
MAPSSFFKRLRVKLITEETPSAKSFVLEPVDDWNPVYRAGQFITLVFQTQHGEKRRSYSISSSPVLGEPLRITVKKIENGEFSRMMHNQLKVGDILLSSGISGFFVLPERTAEPRQYFFLAAGSGITPCFPMIKELLREGKNDVVLLYSNRSENDCIFREEILRLLEKYPEHFQARFLYSNVFNVYESRLSHWLLPQLLRSLRKQQPEQCLFYLCGPFDYMQMAEITLRSEFPRQNIFKENFLHWPRLIMPEPPDRSAHEVTIRFNGAEHHLQVKYPVSILAEAKKNGIDLPYSCEAGRCGSCAATCTFGKTWMAYNEVLTDKEVAQGRTLICQAFPVDGDAVVEM